MSKIRSNFDIFKGVSARWQVQEVINFKNELNQGQRDGCKVIFMVFRCQQNADTFKNQIHHFLSRNCQFVDFFHFKAPFIKNCSKWMAGWFNGIFPTAVKMQTF